MPWKQRFTSGVLVCKEWSRAAIIAPCSVTVELNSQQQLDGFQAWLVKYSKCIQHLTVTHWSNNLRGAVYLKLQLPCSQLQQLESLHIRHHLRLVALPEPEVEVEPEVERKPEPQDVLPKLQEVVLTGCTISDPLLWQLVRGTVLTRLTWDAPTFRNSADRRCGRDTIFPTLWPRLAELPSLSELSMTERSPLSAGRIAGLTSLDRLHALKLKFLCHDASVAGAVLDAVLQLTQLRCLELSGCGFHSLQDPFYRFSALTVSTHLTALKLDDWEVPLPAAAFVHMFSGKLPALKVLSFTNTWGGRTTNVHTEHVSMIAACCTALEQLTLCNVACNVDESCLQKLPSALTQVGGLDWRRTVVVDQAGI
jgi:hypothetical protein